MSIKIDVTNVVKVSGFTPISNKAEKPEKSEIKSYEYDAKKPVTYDEAVSRAYINRDLNIVDKDVFIKQIQKDGLDKEINWDSLKLDLANISGGVFDNIDFISSKYSVLKNQIEKDFQEEDLKKQMNLLDDIFDSTINKVSNQFSSTVGGFLDSNGLSGEKDKIYNSVKNIYAKQVENYSKYISENDNYANIKSKDDKWLERDSSYMHTKLRDAYKSEVYKPETNNEVDKTYSKDELSVMATFVETVKNPIYKGTYTSFRQNEEILGLDFGIAEIKTNILLDNSNLKKDIKDKINIAKENYFKNVIEEYNKKYANSQLIPQDKRGYAMMDTQAIQAVYKFVIAKYNSSKDILTTINESTNYAKNRYEEKQQDSRYSDIYRYSRGTEFFENMDKIKYKHGYAENQTIKGTIIDGWNKFINDANLKNKDSFIIKDNNFSGIA